MSKRRKPLVLGHLEDISQKGLEKFQTVIRRMIHRRAGIYALYRKGRLYYVGLASSLASRLKDHLRDRHERRWDRFSVYLTISDQHMKELESLLLKIAKPEGNKQKGRFAKSRDLQRELHRRVRADSDREFATLLGGRLAARYRRRLARSGRGEYALEGVFERQIRLRAEWQDRTYRASLRRDGKVYLNGRVSPSPSAAARAVGSKRNGWTFWKFKGPNATWVPLKALKGG